MFTITASMYNGNQVVDYAEGSNLESAQDLFDTMVIRQRAMRRVNDTTTIRLVEISERTGWQPEILADAYVPIVMPDGLTSFEPMRYSTKRWNGVVWTGTQVNAYNDTLALIEDRHRAGMSTRHLIDGLYNMALLFDTPNPEDLNQDGQ